jgi:hypothetical protein
VIADVSAYVDVCPHCEKPYEVTWGRDARKKKFWPQSCPLCGAGERADDWVKPPIEVALFIAQRKYLRAREKVFGEERPAGRELGEVYRYLWQYATGKIKRMVAGKVNLLPEVVRKRPAIRRHFLWRGI